MTHIAEYISISSQPQPSCRSPHLSDVLPSPPILFFPTEGVIVANDADSKRSYLLVHQAKRLHSPCFVVTNDDATIFPNLYEGPADHDGTPTPMLFDRVLCDVPCR